MPVDAPPPAQAIGLVALGGALGSSLRYAVGLGAARLFGTGLPVGTWAVNALGCVLIGVAVAFAPTDRVRLFAVVGVLGGFTTFSAYSAETAALWTTGRAGWALANAAGSVLAGIVCVALGLALGRALAS